MGVHEGRGQLSKAMKELLSRWSEATSSWDDAKSKEFEEKHITPLVMDLKMAMSAMDHMAVVLQQISRDCE
ncbi:MAG: hypothetical protein NTU53_08170 [Planctomycetota bacterium]|nr:hypothetical protein [Planctomycetota bacterium]